MRYEVKELGLGGILDQGITLVKNHFGVLFGIVGAVFIPFTVVSGLLQFAMNPPPGPDPTVDEALAFLAKQQEMLPVLTAVAAVNLLLVMPLTQAAMTDAIARLYLGQNISVGSSLGRAFGRIPALVGTWFLLYLAVVVGLILLIIPGIIFAFWFFLATQVVVIEKHAGPKALGRSKELMSGNIGKAFVLGLVLALIGFGMGFVGGLVPNAYLQLAVNAIVQGGMMLLSAAVFVVLYFSTRCQHEDFDLVLLARNVDAEAVPTEDPSD